MRERRKSILYFHLPVTEVPFAVGALGEGRPRCARIWFGYPTRAAKHAAGGEKTDCSVLHHRHENREEEEEIRRRSGEEKKRDFCFFRQGFVGSRNVHVRNTTSAPPPSPPPAKERCLSASSRCSFPPPPCRDIGCGHPVAAIAWEATSGLWERRARSLSSLVPYASCPFVKTLCKKNILLSHTECVQTIPFLAFFSRFVRRGVKAWEGTEEWKSQETIHGRSIPPPFRTQAHSILSLPFYLRNAASTELTLPPPPLPSIFSVATPSPSPPCQVEKPCSFCPSLRPPVSPTPPTPYVTTSLFWRDHLIKRKLNGSGFPAQLDSNCLNLRGDWA